MVLAEKMIMKLLNHKINKELPALYYEVAWEEETLDKYLFFILDKKKRGWKFEHKIYREDKKYVFKLKFATHKFQLEVPIKQYKNIIFVALNEEYALDTFDVVQ